MIMPPQSRVAVATPCGGLALDAPSTRARRRLSATNCADAWQVIGTVPVATLAYGQSETIVTPLARSAAKLSP